MTERRAVIDVGTNSVKVLVGDAERGDVTPIFEQSRQTRLGQGFYESHILQREPIQRTAEAVKSFAIEARSFGAKRVRVIATSAARDAKNKEELVTAIEREAELRVEVISGEQEADWAFEGVTTNPALGGQKLLVLDVGGGSTEFIVGKERHREFARSFPLGTVRLLEQMRVGDPPGAGEWEECRARVRQVLEREVQPQLPATGGALLVGTGGTTSILARMRLAIDEYDRDRMDNLELTREWLAATRRHLWGLRLEERKLIIGLPENRADVILMGAVIFEEVMAVFGFEAMRVSMRGLRFAALMDSAR